MNTFKKCIIARAYFILLISGLLISRIASAETFSTSFEFSDSGTFSIGDPPLTATFSGGSAQTVGIGAYYHSGAFSWHVPSAGLATVSFETPADSVDFWFRDTAGAASSSYRIYDTAETVIASGSGSQSFVNVVVIRAGSETRIARLEFESAGGGDSVVDDFEYTATESAPDFEITMALEEPRGGSIRSGVGNIRGWAISINGIDRVELFVNGQFRGEIPYGGSRNDVGQQNPGIPNSSNSGFSMAFNYNNLGEGEHTVTARAIAGTGGFRELSGTFTVQRFHQSFFSNPDLIVLTDAVVGKVGEAITVQNLSVDDLLYDVRLQWNTQTQGFEIIEILPK